ncbi:MAG TPA: hypothetical protein VGD80_00040, partial [Kofleriaceae bacterium]
MTRALAIAILAACQGGQGSQATQGDKGAAATARPGSAQPGSAQPGSPHGAPAPSDAGAVVDANRDACKAA